MRRTRYGLIVLWMLLCAVTTAEAQVSIGIGLPNLNIGINLPLYPQLVPVPGYPVYYAPQVDANYFFYDGIYWVYQNDNWYASSWYNGPWGTVQPEVVPLFVLRIPVRYYRQPPAYFHGWRANAPPRWGQHWGHGWEQHRSGWDRWQRGSAPRRAPLPVYQRHYSGDRYPRLEQQHELRNREYRYHPRDKAVRRHFQRQGEQRVPAPGRQGRQAELPLRSPAAEDLHGSQPQHQSPPQERGRSGHDQRQPPGDAEREKQTPREHDREQRPQKRGESQDQSRGHGQGQNRDEGRGR